MTNESIDDLKTAIQGVIVKDYGDFKRKSILYINRYVESLGELSEETKRQVFLLKWAIQYHPSGDIEETRQWTLQQVEALA